MAPWGSPRRPPSLRAELRAYRWRVHSYCVPASGVVMAAVVLSLRPCVLIRPPLVAALRESAIDHYR